MERMIEILKYLKDDEFKTLPDMTMDIGISKDEIQKLQDLGILRRRGGSHLFDISSRNRTHKVVELLLDSPKEISQQELISLGVSNYHIRKLLNEGKFTMVRKGVYQSNVANVKIENLPPSQNLNVTKEMLEAIEENNLPEVLRILEETHGNEFIELSKGLWKWVMTQILGNESLNKNEPKKQEPIEEESISDCTSILEEDTQESNLAFIEESEEEQKESLSKEIPSSPTISTEPEITEQEFETSNMEYTPTGLPLKELYVLFLKNKSKDPMLAKEFLLEYKDQCEIQGIRFNYLDLKKINQLIEDFNIPSNQLAEEQELKIRINDFMKRDLNPIEQEDLKEMLNQFYDLYQERGILSNLYRGDYQEKIKNHSEALRIYNSILQKTPWNITIYHRIASILLKTGKVDQLIHVLETSLSYAPYDDFWRAQLVFCYIDKHKLSKARELLNPETFNKTGQYEYCLRTVILKLKDKIFQYKKYARGNASLAYCESMRRKIESTSLELEYYQELYSQLANYEDLEEEMMMGESLLSPYIDEVYWATLNEENGYICPGKLENYVGNLQISLDEELLLYIAAAKVMFIHKLPNYGEHYLKLVSKSHSKNPVVKREYQQCIKNKKLYLNK